MSVLQYPFTPDFSARIASLSSGVLVRRMIFVEGLRRWISEIASIPIKKVKDIPENVIKSKKSKPDKKEKNLKTITTLKCRNSDCDFKKDRDFQLNDYVFKIYNETCQKCGSRIYISEISHRDIKNSN